MKLEKYEVKEIWNWRNLKLKKFEVEEIWSWNMEIKIWYVVKVRRHHLSVIIETKNFTFEVKVILGLESTRTDD